MDTRNDLTVITNLTPCDFDRVHDDSAGSHLHMFYNAETNAVSLCDSEYEGFGVISKYVGWKHVFGEDLCLKQSSHHYVYVGKYERNMHHVVFNVVETIVEDSNKIVVMRDPCYCVTVSSTECHWTDGSPVSCSEVASRLYRAVKDDYSVKSVYHNGALLRFTIYNIPESKLEELAVIMREAYESATRLDTHVSSLKLGDLFTFTYPGESEPRKYRFICRDDTGTICEWLNAEGGAKAEHLTVEYVNKL